MSFVNMQTECKPIKDNEQSNHNSNEATTEKMKCLEVYDGYCLGDEYNDPYEFKSILFTTKCKVHYTKDKFGRCRLIIGRHYQRKNNYNK